MKLNALMLIVVMANAYHAAVSLETEKEEERNDVLGVSFLICFFACSCDG
jgi:hypothetical protein